VLNRGRPKRRQRFSLAHEIGHIVIPWHIGTIACHTAYDISGFGDYYYRLGEAEANRFAATLLLPAPWVREQIETHSDVRGALGALWETGVSAPAACLRLIQFLSPNTLFVLTDLEGCVEIADVSPGSSVKAPARGTPLRRGALDPVSSERYTVQLGGRRSRWWVFNERVELEELEDDTASSASLLDSLLTRHFKPAERAAKRNRIAGIIGYANGKAGDADAIQLHGVLRGAFAARDDLEGLVQDPDFATFLSLRAGELRE
jgi:hypothetical protein